MRIDVRTGRMPFDPIEGCCIRRVKNVLLHCVGDETYDLGVDTVLSPQRCCIGLIFGFERSRDRGAGCE